MKSSVVSHSVRSAFPAVCVLATAVAIGTAESTRTLYGAAQVKS